MARINDKFCFNVHYVVTKGNDFLRVGEKFIIRRYPKWIQQCDPQKKYEILVSRWDTEHNMPHNLVMYYTSKHALLAALEPIQATPDQEYAEQQIKRLEAELQLVKLQYGFYSR